MTNSQFLAYQMVDSRLDDGDKFHAMCRELAFNKAVEHARYLRAFFPGMLRQMVATKTLPPNCPIQ